MFKELNLILKSKWFASLEGKTQIFSPANTTGFTNRQSHSYIVASNAAVLAERFPILDPRQVYLIGLTHDIGHCAFGHDGEAIFKKHYFPYYNDHNEVGAFILHQIFKRSQLNYKYLIEATLKHNGARPIDSKLAKAYKINPNTEPSLATQFVSIIDDITYIRHDIDDGVLRGTLSEMEIAESIGVTYDENESLSEHIYTIVSDSLQYNNGKFHLGRQDILHKVKTVIFDKVIAAEVVQDERKEFLIKLDKVIAQLAFDGVHLLDAIALTDKEIVEFKLR